MGKKPKTPKKKKKKDPNEPQKPVSAYALFFRDTQAAIKGQNPNATFGEVSKIVASMWDGLGEEQKQVRRASNRVGLNMVWYCLYILIEIASDGSRILQIPETGPNVSITTRLI